MGKPKRKSGRGKQKVKEQTAYDIWESVTDYEVEDYTCDIKSEKELDDIGFPNARISVPSLKDLANCCLADVEWITLVSKMEEQSNIEFADLSEEEQREHRKQMAEELRIKRRHLMWKKYQFALERNIEDCNVQLGLSEEDHEEEGVEASSDSVVRIEGDIVEEKRSEDLEEEGVEAASSGSVGRIEEDIVEEKRSEDSEEEGVEAAGVVRIEENIVEEKRSEENLEEEGFKAGIVLGSEEGPSATGGGPISEEETKWNPNMVRFPCFEDGDDISPYSEPFSLRDWLNNHIADSSRYLPHVKNDLVLGLDVMEWNGDRLRRESLGIIQSVLSGVLDYHERKGPHGNIADYAKIKLHQYVLSVGGCEKVLYHIELPTPKLRSQDFSELQGLSEDIRQVILIFRRVLQGRDLSSDMSFLIDLMGSYPFDDSDAWKNKLLRNCPSMWDGKVRANFIVDFYYNLVSDSQKSVGLNKALLQFKNLIPLHDLNLWGWIEKIPETSVFFKILTFSANPPANAPANPPAANAPANPPANAPANPPKPEYIEGATDEVLRYMRATLHHHRRAKGVAGLKEINYIEMSLSNLFKCFTIGLYIGMCRYNVFFS